MENTDYYLSGAYVVKTKKINYFLLTGIENISPEEENNFKVLIFPSEIFVENDEGKKIITVAIVPLDGAGKIERTIVDIRDLILNNSIICKLLHQAQKKGWNVSVFDFYDLRENCYDKVFKN